jgi:uncharacterized protein YbaR (Trm112 family)
MLIDERHTRELILKLTNTEGPRKEEMQESGKLLCDAANRFYGIPQTIGAGEFLILWVKSKKLWLEVSGEKLQLTR